jgi:antitoxin (DNA-binding transcriptional repressor) of toxin-antitoxin stability system
MTDLDFREVIERWDAILDAAQRGETFRVFRNERPVAVLEPSQYRALDQGEATSPAV